MALVNALTVPLTDVLHPGTLGYVSPIPQRRDAFLTNHVGGFVGADFWKPDRYQIIVHLADELLALGARPPTFR